MHGAACKLLGVRLRVHRAGVAAAAAQLVGGREVDCGRYL